MVTFRWNPKSSIWRLLWPVELPTPSRAEEWVVVAKDQLFFTTISVTPFGMKQHPVSSHSWDMSLDEAALMAGQAPLLPQEQRRRRKLHLSGPAEDLCHRQAAAKSRTLACKHSWPPPVPVFIPVWGSVGFGGSCKARETQLSAAHPESHLGYCLVV